MTNYIYHCLVCNVLVGEKDWAEHKCGATTIEMAHGGAAVTLFGSDPICELKEAAESFSFFKHLKTEHHRHS